MENTETVLHQRLDSKETAQDEEWSLLYLRLTYNLFFLVENQSGFILISVSVGYTY